MSNLFDDLLALPPQERVEIAQRLWDSVVANPEALPITSSQRDILEKRWQAMQHDGDEGMDWDELRAQLERE